MEFRILGPLEVLRDGARVDLGGAKQHALLACLLLDANRVVSTERLIDALWEESPPEQARKALQVYVSQLRKALGQGRILTRNPGYLLRLEDGELDLERFRRLREKGELAQALALWRGSPLADLEGERFAEPEIARLQELRLATIEDRIEADLAAGRHAALVGELESLVVEHPLRERLRAQLMLALYRSGRQAEALEAFQSARRALVDELGIEPSRALRDLHQAILRQDSALELESSTEPEPEIRLEPSSSRSDAVPVPDVRAERKTVTVVHVGLSVASDEGDRVDPEILNRVLTRALADITVAIEAHEGTIDTVTGDSVSGVFGLPVVHEDDPLRAARAADEVRERLMMLAQEHGTIAQPRLEARIGVSTGEIMTGGAPGARLRATGAPLTTAAHLARDAEADSVALDETTRRAVAARRDGTRFASPMVGRERERRRLHDAFEQAAGDRSCQLFTILGAAGVGKSRLVQEFLGDLASRALVARGRCLPYGEGITFWPVLEAIKDVTGLDDTETPEQARSRLAAIVGGDPAADAVAQRVIEVMGLTETTSSLDDGFAAVRAFFEVLAASRPLVVVFDDVHWGEETFLDLVEHLADWSRGAPIVVLCIARPELLDVRPSWSGGKLNATTVLLEPLSDDECVELLANLVGEAKLAEEVEERISRAAEGNPLFVEEVLSMLIDDGLLVRENGRWAAAGDLRKVPVPPTIQALLAARLDQLGGDERACMEAAAVEGQVFHEGSVAQLAATTTASSALAALVRKELVRPEPPVFSGERAFRFRHLLIRDAAYESIPKESRATLHEQHVTWLEAKVGEQAVEFDEIVGYHLEQAFRYRRELGPVDEHGRRLGRRAADLLGAAARRAFARSDAPAAINLVSRAVELLPPDDPLRVDLVPNVRVIQGARELEWAERVLDDAIAAGDERLAAHARVQRGFLRLFTSEDVDPGELLAVAGQAIQVFTSRDDDRGLARSWRLVAQANYLGRQAGRCEEASERALQHALRVGDRFEQREIVEWLGVAFFLGPTEARTAEQKCERLLEQLSGDPVLEANIVGALAYLVGIQGRSDEARMWRDEGRRIMDELGEGVWVAPIEFALVALGEGDPVSAERELRPRYERLLEIGEQTHFCSVATVLAQALYAQGRYDEAETFARDAAETAGPIEVHSRIIGRATTAKILARRGDVAAAERLARNAVAFAADSDFLTSRGDALSDLAEVLLLAERMDEARAALDEAIRNYAQKGNQIARGRATSVREGLQHARRA
jgi:DNA-binding SARP family transcriptional activator